MRTRMPKLFLSFLAAMTVSSCGEMTDTSDTMPVAMTASAGENSINTLDILVFDTHGNLVSAGRNPSGDAVVLDVPKGMTAVVYAVANSRNNLSLVSTEAQLASLESHLKDNDPGNFEMLGKSVQNLDGVDNLNIGIDRFAVKVVLDGIRLDLSDPVWASAGVNTIRITDIFLTNVVPGCNYSLTSVAAESDWYNKMDLDASSPAGALLHESMEVDVANGGSLAGKHSFYAYPNPTVADTGGGTWSARHTRLVVKAELDGSICYYPITLPVLERNHCYTIQGLTITGAGSDNPDVLDKRTPMSFTVDIAPWLPEDRNANFS